VKAESSSLQRTTVELSATLLSLTVCDAVSSALRADESVPPANLCIIISVRAHYKSVLSTFRCVSIARTSHDSIYHTTQVIINTTHLSAF
jgi:hypothetical protein